MTPTTEQELENIRSQIKELCMKAREIGNDMFPISETQELLVGSWIAYGVLPYWINEVAKKGNDTLEKFHDEFIKAARELDYIKAVA